MAKKTAIALVFLMLAVVVWGLFFVFAGIGIFILGGLIFIGLIIAGFSFPFLLVLLLPLAIVWLFIAITRKTGA